uniref:Uncharacterized protein n=1 Tax=Paramoeba aestuarina TaxID=180227 RepID=A0A7S4NAV7_9EUKA|mmetsp:Transcript_13342/g.20596  ORF Transcript_13342/g.20596 Transcript_13342/m.20596 type:complete len:104 (+) Transcript_13342:197-508(+)
MGQLNSFVENGLALTIIGNKTDCEHLRQVTMEEMLASLKFRNNDQDTICLIETSAKDPHNLEKIMDHIVDQALVAHQTRSKKQEIVSLEGRNQYQMPICCTNS